MDAEARLDCSKCALVGERCTSRYKPYRKEWWTGHSDYAGMSNDKAGENPARRKPKVSWGR
jgi:hypothetical protein